MINLETNNFTFGCTKHSGRQCTLLGLDVSEGEPPGVPADYQRGRGVSAHRIIGVFVFFQHGQSHCSQSHLVRQIRVVVQ